MKKRIISKVIVCVLIVACKNNDSQKTINPEEQLSETNHLVENQAKQLAELKHSIAVSYTHLTLPTKRIV